MRFRCTACPQNCTPPGKLRGFRLRDHVCPCGGALARGTNADGPTVSAVPLAPEQRGVPEERLGLKRSTSLPRTRGAVRLELVVAMVILGPLVAAGLVYGVVWLSRRWLLSLPHAVRCDTCGSLIEAGLEPVIRGRCLACKYAVRQGLA